MRKIILVLSFILVMGLVSAFAYAETTKGLEVDNWHQERMDFRRAELDKSLEDGLITDEEYQTWDEHFNYMENFHKENGFPNGQRFGRGCHNGFRESNGNGMMMNRRFSRSNNL